jgi:hypothetical protein
MNEKEQVKEIRQFFYSAIGMLPKRRYRKLAADLIETAKKLDAMADKLQEERAEAKRDKEPV